MRKTKIIFLAALLTVALASCNFMPDLKSNNNNLNVPLEEGQFYAQNMLNESYYIVKADMLTEGEYCVIWAEKGSGITQNKAREIANEYDTIIRPKIAGTFSKKKFSVTAKNGAVFSFDDMLDYANWLADRTDRKLTILLLDIKDGFKNPKTDSYVAGYFWAGNFYSQGKIPGYNAYSNGRDMIYVDTDPGLKTEAEQTYATFAHELQHLISYVTSVQMGRKKYLDTWIDEGLSSQAEYLYLEKNPKDKCEWFSNDRDGTIANGNNFFVWGNHQEKPMAIYDDYATVYLFFRWLYLQADNELKTHIFYDIETSNNYDYWAVVNAAQRINPAWNTWETTLRTWLAANYYPKNPYGYSGDNYLKETIKVKPITRPTISLAPGEGVYSIINTPFSVEDGTAIRYAGLAGNESIIGDSSPYAGDILLTFNANVNSTAANETGKLTGVVSSIASQMAERSTQPEFTGPYVIDARDILGRTER